MAWLDPDTDEVKLVGVVSFGKGEILVIYITFTLILSHTAL